MAIENFDQVTIAPAKLRPFSKFIMSIGELPTSYLDSLSYAEQVTWFCDYLQNRVIPAIDNNAEALKEVQNLMTELQTYVSDYFDNLDVQEEVNNKLDEMVEDGTLSDIIGQYVDLTDNVYIAPLTNVDTFKDQNSKACLGISFDGQCFTPIPGTENFCEKDTDIQLFKYNDYYLFACTTGASDNFPNIDVYVGWTQDFETYHFESVNLGFTQYRNTNYPEAADDYRRWTPRFYLDKENNLNILLSMATDNTLAYDAWEIQQRTKMTIFHQTVTFNGNNTNFLTGNGDIDVFKIRENNTDIDTFFDGELIYKDNVYYLFYKNGYYNDVCMAISTTDDYSIFNATKLNLFGQPYTEAPTIVKNGEGYYLYGQQYITYGFNTTGRNMLLYTKDFTTFNAIGFPRKINNDIETKGWLRNLSPCLITNKALILKFKGEIDLIGYGCYSNDDLKIQFNSQKTLEIYKESYNLGRTDSILPNSWICRDTTLQDIHINNIWNTTNFVIWGANANLDPYAIQFAYKNASDRIVMTGSYPTGSFN